MRFSPIAIGLSLVFATVSSSVSGQRPDDEIDPESIALLEQSRAALAAGELDQAADLAETALALDPRNREGFIVLAETARARELPGKAVRLYRQALSMEPNDLAALEGQGEALVERGAVERARQNLARIESICETRCVSADELAAAIAAGPPPEVLAAQNQDTVPPPGEESESVSP